jgi:hypothetical protein
MAARSACSDIWAGAVTKKRISIGRANQCNKLHGIITKVEGSIQDIIFT